MGVSFYEGLKFEEIKRFLQNFFYKPVACTTEVKICPDGSSVGRIPPKCDFAPCPQEKPNPTKVVEKLIPCRDFFKNECPEGYYCILDKNFPDRTGFCQKKENQFECPQSDYLNCMPGPERKSECNPVYLQWVKDNCPNFKGLFIERCLNYDSFFKWQMGSGERV